MIFDEDDKPIDYRFLETNAAFERQTGLKNAQGRRMRDLAPLYEEYWFQIYGEIALTGRPARFQNRAEQLHRWYDVYAFRFGKPENRQVAILFNDITESRDLSERDHRIAEILQQALIPPMKFLRVETCSIAVKCEPAMKEAEVGGDFYDFFDLGNGRVGIVIGDVAGKGLLAAVYVAAAKHAIRNYAYVFASPARIMTLANEALCKEQVDDKVESSMLTASLAIVDTRRAR